MIFTSCFLITFFPNLKLSSKIGWTAFALFATLSTFSINGFVVSCVFLSSFADKPSVNSRTAAIPKIANINPNPNSYVEIHNILEKVLGYDNIKQDFVQNDDSCIEILKFRYNNKDYEIKYITYYAQDTRTINDVNDETVQQFIASYHKQTGGGYSYLFESLFDKSNDGIKDIIKYLQNPNFVFYNSMLGRLAQLLNEEYGINGESSVYDVIQKLKEYIEDISQEIPDYSVKYESLKYIMTIIDIDLCNRYPEYKNKWKELYLKRTAPKDTHFVEVN